MKAQAKSEWQVQEAKTHLSAVIKQASLCGPQVITRHGTECGAVISLSDLHALRTLQARKPNFFVEYLLNGPTFESNGIVDEIFERNPETPRDIDLSDLIFEAR